MSRFSFVIAVAAMCQKDGWQVLQRTGRPHEMRRMNDSPLWGFRWRRQVLWAWKWITKTHPKVVSSVAWSCNIGCFLGGDSRIVCGIKRHIQPFTQNPDGLSLCRFKNAMWIEDSSKTAPLESFCDMRIPSRRIRNKVASNEPGSFTKDTQANRGSARMIRVCDIQIHCCEMNSYWHAIMQSFFVW